ncbi:MAG: hypothetical protein A2X34_06465 [Elusimicrobia bacterium GWC2_51_8]|nr:MAG: hypothetical protein A2X33_08290 [Elusimicrobia bacterium GWA2_51_34]OGR61263.1 MAG: hypothetical protein A2X34_06465 [Elusimicrobia bacterium GWC2_51_8]OGR86018.1 MAG: hypothetical protein A2021_05370 [Elusimicrobia bacterium GWF2_52_66]HAF94503.1 hypothetical protein [Elusimicrobiota bacterium]HCE98938.1 hypothetical protein [Elusimicrobiota bacterium]
MFEDTPPCAVSLGLANSGAALEAPGCAGLNPALSGSARKFVLNTDFLSSFRVGQGPADFKAYSVGAAFPLMSYGRLGTMGIGGSYRDDGGILTEKTMSFAAGTWQFLKTNSGMIDFGVNFKILQAAVVKGGESQAGAAMDLGALLRSGEGRTLGFSILNLNKPSFAVGTLKEKAPLSVRLGAAEKHEDYTIIFEAAQRTASGALPGNFSFASGVEHLWRTYRYGVFASRTGLFLARRASAVSLGLGFKRLASEISYSLSMPLTGEIKTAHALTLTLRFGDRDIEPEYERLMRQEIKYRKDLVMALDESAKRENILKDQLALLKIEIDGLSEELRASEEKKDEVRAAKEKLEAVIGRQRKAEAELKVLAEKRKSDKLNSLRFDFAGDWQSYLKLKSGGAPAEALKGTLQRLVGQYQDTGIDISQATIELRGLLGY